MKEVEPLRTVTMRELMEDLRLRTGVKNFGGHDLMDLARFHEETRHMVIFDVLIDDSQVANQGDRIRLFLSDEGYQKALENQACGNIRILSYARVVCGDLYYDSKDQVC